MDALRLAQDLFFIPLGPGPNLGFDRAIVTGILSKGRVTKPVMAFSCQYLDGSRGEAYGIDGDPTQGRIKHLAFDRFEGRMMMERIFGLADALDAFLAWSDVWNNEPNACVTREERLALVGADAKKALTFAVARDASHLNQLITGNTFEENGWQRITVATHASYVARHSDGLDAHVRKAAWLRKAMPPSGVRHPLAFRRPVEWMPYPWQH